MEWDKLFYIFASGWPVGLFLALFWNYLERKATLKKVKAEGEHIFLLAKEKADSLFKTHQKEFHNLNRQKIAVFEKEKEKRESQIREWQAELDKKFHQFKLKNSERDQSLSQIKKTIHKMDQTSGQRAEEKAQLLSDLKTFAKRKAEKLEKKFSINWEQFKKELKESIEESWLNKINKDLEKRDKQNRQNLQKDSFFHLNMVLSRFDRVYCPERRIPPVIFRTSRQREKVMGPKNAFLNEVEKECGVDILVNTEDQQAVVLGIDPVRREWGRITLQKLSKKHRVNIPIIKTTVRQSKKELFSKIRRDGQNICRKLRLKNISSPVQNMMGALRYRYSFAQNQYFHCEEVGWLCGLLSAEMNLPIKPAHRSGMFHDIGKAMDHSVEGNHAVIGADFLSKHKEREEILHAVRAHHHDESPSTALAYLVIVADSISGSRPGARRFTEDSYNQKMASLERIIDSFENIEDAYIMSAGREMRVIVNNKKISDKGALDLSRLIARKIEQERSYPGLIKITVVRLSEKIAMA